MGVGDGEEGKQDKRQSQLVKSLLSSLVTAVRNWGLFLLGLRAMKNASHNCPLKGHKWDRHPQVLSPDMSRISPRCHLPRFTSFAHTCWVVPVGVLAQCLRSRGKRVAEVRCTRENQSKMLGSRACECDQVQYWDQRKCRPTEKWPSVCVSPFKPQTPLLFTKVAARIFFKCLHVALHSLTCLLVSWALIQVPPH